MILKCQKIKFYSKKCNITCWTTCITIFKHLQLYVPIETILTIKHFINMLLFLKKYACFSFNTFMAAINWPYSFSFIVLFFFSEIPKKKKTIKFGTSAFWRINDGDCNVDVISFQRHIVGKQTEMQKISICNCNFDIGLIKSRNVKLSFMTCIKFETNH